MDVKIGSGAFMPTRERGAGAGDQHRRVARGAGLPARALLTDMGQCLGQHRRQRARGRREHRHAQGRRLRPAAARGDAGAGGRGAAPGRPGGRPPRTGRATADGPRVGRRRRAVRAHGARARRAGGPARAAGRASAAAPDALPRSSRPGPASSPPSTRARWASPWSSLAAGGAAPPTMSRPAVGLDRGAGIGDGVARTSPCAWSTRARCGSAAASVAGRLRDAFMIAESRPGEPPIVRERLA